MEGLEICKSNAKIPTTTPLVSKLARDLGYDILTEDSSPPTSIQEKRHPIFKNASTQTSSTSLLMAKADSAKNGKGMSTRETQTSDTGHMGREYEEETDCCRPSSCNTLNSPEIKQLETWRLMYQNVFQIYGTSLTDGTTFQNRPQQ